MSIREKLKNKKILIGITIVILLIIIIVPILIINNDSYKLNQYLKQNYTSYAEFKNNGYILVKKDNKFGILDYNKNTIYDCIYENVAISEYRNTYLITLKDSEKYILLNSKLQEIANSKNEILIYLDEGYYQTWNENKFKLISIDNNEVLAEGNIKLENNSIEHTLNNNYRLITTTNTVEKEDNTTTEEINCILYNSNNEIVYENTNISLFNDKYLLIVNEQGYKLIDFYGKDVTIFYSSQIKSKNGEIFLIDENNNNLVKLKITKSGEVYDVVKEKVIY